MSSLSALFGSSTALNQGSSTFLFLTASDTISFAVDVDIIVHAIGGSGTGGACNSIRGHASGAGGPGYCRKKDKLPAGTSLVITIGAAGGSNSPVAGSRANGAAGGATTVVGGPFNMTANGGGAGNATETNAACAGGLGGTASGGDVNFTGGRGGNIVSMGSLLSNYRATGAGAVNLFGLGQCNGGDIISTTGNVVTGGGNPVASTGDNQTNAVPLSRLYPPNVGSTVAYTLLTDAILGFINPIGPSGASPGPLAGSNGNNSANAANSGIFGGGGGAIASSGSFNAQNNSGSSGGCATSASGGNSQSTRAGLVVIEVLG